MQVEDRIIGGGVGAMISMKWFLKVLYEVHFELSTVYEKSMTAILEMSENSEKVLCHQ